jgi:hypothetical protein
MMREIAVTPIVSRSSASFMLSLQTWRVSPTTYTYAPGVTFPNLEFPSAEQQFALVPPALRDSAEGEGSVRPGSNLSREYVNKIKAGRYDPPLSTSDALARALGVAVGSCWREAAWVCGSQAMRAGPKRQLKGLGRERA